MDDSKRTALFIACSVASGNARESTAAVAAVLLEDADPFVTGAAEVFPYWQARGAWPMNPESCLVGAALAQELDLGPGDRVELTTDQRSTSVRIVGVLTSGKDEDEAIVAPLSVVQRLAGLPASIEMKGIRALQTPLVACRMMTKYESECMAGRLSSDDLQACRKTTD